MHSVASQVHQIHADAPWAQCPAHVCQRCVQIVDVFKDGTGYDQINGTVKPAQTLRLNQILNVDWVISRRRLSWHSEARICPVTHV